jgi:UDP-N-acetylglucosamine--N-acetylmuramyl-(pentapeptide) pyrophosphoryl-undecaprenol N-acetylglucosamine transferase
VISAALSLGVPVLVHEQNVVPGLVVSRYARKVNRVLLTKPLAGSPLAARTQVVGMPLRPGILIDGRPEWFSEFGLEPNRKTLLIFGGSQGARALCRTGVELARQWETTRPGWQVLLQTGTANLDWVEAENPPQNVVRISHIREMGKAYACADLIVARSGAVSCAELEVVGKPAVLVPYPHATRDHQRLNAEAFVRENAGRIVLEEDLTTHELEDALRSLEGIVARGRDLSTVSAPVEKIIAALDEAAGGGRS